MPELRAAGFDLVVDLQGLFRSAAMARLTGCARRIGFANAREGSPLMYTERVAVPATPMHAVDRYLLVAEALGAVRPARPRFDFIDRPADRQAVDTLIARAGIDESSPWVAMNVSARWETKRWPPQHFAEAADQLAEWYGVPVVLMGGPAERPESQAVTGRMRTKAVDLTGQTPVGLLPGLLRRASLRGFDRFVPEQYGYFDARNFWRTTQGKGHATPLMRFGRGLRDCDWNMPNANGVTWKRLTGSTKYLSVSFSASASYTASKLILLIRKRVPAGTTGSPGTLTAELCSDSSGDPGTVLETVTVTASDIADVVSEYYVWTISEAFTSGTPYHVKVYGATGDRDEACWEVGCDNDAAGKRSSAGSSWTATTYSPYYRVTDADKARTFKQFMFLVGCASAGRERKIPKTRL